MFGSRTKNSSTPATPPDLPPTRTERSADATTTARTGGFLSSGVSIKGNLTFQSELLIDGQVQGKINATGKLTVGKNARIRGEIRTKSVTIQGTIEGNVFASERCVLEPVSSVHGNIEAQRLAVGENATFLGSAKITANRG